MTTVRRIVFETAMTLEGCHTLAVDSMAWLRAADERVLRRYGRRYDTVLFGRKSYEAVMHGARQPAGRTTCGWPLFAALFAARKYVLSHTARHVTGNGMIIGPDVAAEVSRLRRECGKDILVYGGLQALDTLAALDLVDEYRVFLHPAGGQGGSSALSRRLASWPLRLVKRARLSSGMVLLKYHPISRTHEFNRYDRSIQDQCLLP